MQVLWDYPIVSAWAWALHSTGRHSQVDIWPWGGQQPGMQKLVCLRWAVFQAYLHVVQQTLAVFATSSRADNSLQQLTLVHNNQPTHVPARLVTLFQIEHPECVVVAVCLQAFFEHFQSLPGQQRLIGYTVYGDKYYAGPGQCPALFCSAACAQHCMPALAVL